MRNDPFGDDTRDIEPLHIPFEVSKAARTVGAVGGVQLAKCRTFFDMFDVAAPPELLDPGAGLYERPAMKALDNFGLYDEPAIGTFRKAAASYKPGDRVMLDEHLVTISTFESIGNGFYRLKGSFDDPKFSGLGGDPQIYSGIVTSDQLKPADAEPGSKGVGSDGDFQKTSPSGKSRFYRGDSIPLGGGKRPKS